MTKVKVFIYGRGHRQHLVYDNSYPYLPHSELKSRKGEMLIDMKEIAIPHSAPEPMLQLVFTTSPSLTICTQVQGINVYKQ